MGNNILFEIINALFSDKEYINSLTAETAVQNLFMVNRRLAIKYPMQAQAFNIMKVNSKDVLRFWSDFLYCGKTPNWIYLSSKKSNLKHGDKISETLLKKYAQMYKIGLKDIRAALIFNTNISKEMKEFEKLIKEIENAKSNNKGTDSACE